jgi:hypothetical protein
METDHVIDVSSETLQISSDGYLFIFLKVTLEEHMLKLHSVIFHGFRALDKIQ